jgi:hypothetical protein
MFLTRIRALKTAGPVSHDLRHMLAISIVGKALGIKHHGDCLPTLVGNVPFVSSCPCLRLSAVPGKTGFRNGCQGWPPRAKKLAQFFRVSGARHQPAEPG